MASASRSVPGLRMPDGRRPSLREENRRGNTAEVEEDHSPIRNSQFAAYASNSLASELLSPNFATETSILWAIVNSRLLKCALGFTGLWQIFTSEPGSSGL